jgi:phospholipase/carboxylesterase
VRQRLTTPIVLLASLVAAGCSLGQAQDRAASQGRLTARPGPVAVAPAPGFSALSIGRGDRDGLLFIPRSASGPVPLVVLLHGAGGSAQGIRRRLFGTSDSIDFALLVPDSRGPTWDAIRRDYGPDVAFIDSALKVVFSRVAIDPRRVIVSGFSDGASYAIGLGRVNGDLFTRVVAFSPGFVTGGSPTGKPEVFITHGDDDPILPFEATSGRIVPAMRRSGYSVTLKRFIGGHTIPPDLVREAFLWAISSNDQRR